MLEDEAILVKRGEICTQVTFQRGRIPTEKGGSALIVEAKIHPQMEAVIASFGTGEVVDVRQWGRNWHSGTKDSLFAYDIVQPEVQGTLGEGRNLYTLDYLGQPLLLGMGKNDPINLSFLRLKGLSEGAGIKFYVRGVYTLDQVRNIAERVQEASRSFYINYMKPVGVTVMVSTQELQGASL